MTRSAKEMAGRAHEIASVVRREHLGSPTVMQAQAQATQAMAFAAIAAAISELADAVRDAARPVAAEGSDT